MTKAELVKLVARENRLTMKQAEKVLETAFDVIARQVAKGERFAWPTFGVFYQRRSKGRRIAAPPGTPDYGSLMNLGPTHCLGFRASKFQKGRG